jgi:predicted DCC family thiol-disulfide oxidoreductase YuxK
MRKTVTKVIRNRPIVFFDGVCNLCNGFVDFLVRRDNEKLHFHFASLQVQASQELLPATLRAELNTVVLWEEGKIYLESSAALRVLAKLGGPYSLLIVFLVIPPFLRNFIYRIVSTNRYKWFGKRESCRLPTVSERAYFLD